MSLVSVGTGVPMKIVEQTLQRQRYNVAVSRAQDQLCVVHSLDPQTELKTGDLRRSLIEHALNPAALMESSEAAVAQAESPFEAAVIEWLHRAGFGRSLSIQHRVGAYRIDIVIEGENGRRLAVECDGERWHRPEDLERDMGRQADLERLGWRFVRIRGSAFYRDADAALEPLFAQMTKLGITPKLAETSSAQEPGELVQRVIAKAGALLARLDEAGGFIHPVTKARPTPKLFVPSLRDDRRTPLASDAKDTASVKATS